MLWTCRDDNVRDECRDVKAIRKRACFDQPAHLQAWSVFLFQADSYKILYGKQVYSLPLLLIMI